MSQLFLILFFPTECDFVRNKCIHTEKCLFCIGADLERKDGDGDTPLIQASGHGKVDAVRTLIAAGKMTHLSQQQSLYNT